VQREKAGRTTLSNSTRTSTSLSGENRRGAPTEERKPANVVTPAERSQRVTIDAILTMPSVLACWQDLNNIRKCPGSLAHSGRVFAVGAENRTAVPQGRTINLRPSGTLSWISGRGKGPGPRLCTAGTDRVWVSSPPRSSCSRLSIRASNHRDSQRRALCASDRHRFEFLRPRKKNLNLGVHPFHSDVGPVRYGAAHAKRADAAKEAAATGTQAGGEAAELRSGMHSTRFPSADPDLRGAARVREPLVHKLLLAGRVEQLFRYGNDPDKLHRWTSSARAIEFASSP